MTIPGGSFLESCQLEAIGPETAKCNSRKSHPIYVHVGRPSTTHYALRHAKSLEESQASEAARQLFQLVVLQGEEPP